MVGIFPEDSGIGKVGKRRFVAAFHNRDTFEPYLSAEHLVISVESSIKSNRKFVRFIYLILIQEIGESRMLTGNIFRLSEI